MQSNHSQVRRTIALLIWASADWLELSGGFDRNLGGPGDSNYPGMQNVSVWAISGVRQRRSLFHWAIQASRSFGGEREIPFTTQLSRSVRYCSKLHIHKLALGEKRKIIICPFFQQLAQATGN